MKVRIARAAVTAVILVLYVREMARARRWRREIATWGTATRDVQYKAMGRDS